MAHSQFARTEREALGAALLQGLPGVSAAVEALVANALMSHDPRLVSAVLDEVAVRHAPHAGWDLLKGYRDLLEGRIDAALAAFLTLSQDQSPDIRAAAGIFRGMCLMGRRDATAIRVVEAALAETTPVRLWLRAYADNTLGGHWLYQHQATRATACFAAAAEGFEAVGDAVGQGKALANQAAALDLCGRPDAAIPLLEKAVTLAREQRSIPGIGLYAVWAICLEHLGRMTEAEAKYTEGLTLAETLGLATEVIQSLMSRAMVRMLNGRLDDAAADVVRMQPLADSYGAPYNWRIWLLRSDLAIWRQDLGQASECWLRAVALSKDENADDAREIHLTGARLALAKGDPGAADRCLAPLAESLKKTDMPFMQALVLTYRQQVCHLRGDSPGEADCRRRIPDLVPVEVARYLALPYNSEPVSGDAPSGISVQTFGMLQVRQITGRNVFGRLQSMLPRRLLASLLVKPEGLTGSTLLERFYDGDPNHKKALQTLIHRLRDRLDKALRHPGAAPAILCVDGCYRLNPEWPLQSDLAAFRQACDTWLHADGPDERTNACERMISLYKGPLFADLPADEWLVAAREAVRTQWLNAVDWYLSHLVRQGDGDRVEIIVARCAAIDPGVPRPHWQAALHKLIRE